MGIIHTELWVQFCPRKADFQIPTVHFLALFLLLFDKCLLGGCKPDGPSLLVSTVFPSTHNYVSI